MYVKIQGYKTILVDTMTKFDATPGAQVDTITPIADVGGNLDGKYFYMWSENNKEFYCLWVNVDVGGNQPVLNELFTSYESIDISSGDAAQDVSDAIVTTLNGIAGTPYSAANSGGGVVPVTVTYQANGRGSSPIDFNTGFTMVTTTEGVGATLSGTDSVWWRITGKMIVDHNPPRGMEDKRLFDFVDVEEIVWTGMISEMWD